MASMSMGRLQILLEDDWIAVAISLAGRETHPPCDSSACYMEHY